MKIFNPDNNTTHLINIIPESYPSKVYLIILHELSGTSTTFEPQIGIENGYMVLQIEDFIAKEGASYELTVKDWNTEKVIYRGKAFATSAADLQNYKLTQ